ncbi:MAG TPA: bifunctional glutamate N-acetyltransferase/amino-acid acetyltransferase ArgJ [Candidatus Acidoferrales bacterium]|nr:bifunctional glutamate N-acetyltransferase/amino-acid acetyltransferase ArgJ [Candidatus Acidoferrales bacterium]
MNPHLSASDIPAGFTFAATHCGLKRSRLDLGILISDNPAATAALFTTNQIVAAPVIASREHLRKSGGRMRGLIVNSGNANCCTKEDGYPASIATASTLAAELGGIDPSQILVCSTGVIGAPLRVEKILAAVPHVALSRSAEAGAFEEFARSIMTTDTRPKWATARFRVGGRQVRILGCAKGSGMIEPNMATMLAFIATDAAVAPALLDRALRASVERTFNSITVDGDTSTNDTVAIFANGRSEAPEIKAAGGDDYKGFRAAIESVCKSLALAIVEDGEGAQRTIEIEVRGAASQRAARRIAKTIANSPLVKTAFAGADPNWGRILAAAGRSGVKFDPARVNISIAGIAVCRHGCEHPFDERDVHQKMLAKYVPVRMDLHAGSRAARVWTCDFTIEYVHINSSYRT